MVHFLPGNDFVGDQEQLSAGPVVVFVFDGGLVDGAAIFAIDVAHGFEKQVLAAALRPVNNQCGFHFGAWVLDRVSQPAQYPCVNLLGVVFAGGQVFEQREQFFAVTLLRHRRPAGPQVALDAGVAFGRVEADLLHAHHPPAAVGLPVAHVVFVEAGVAHVGELDQHVFLFVKRDAVGAIHQCVAGEHGFNAVNRQAA